MGVWRRMRMVLIAAFLLLALTGCVQRAGQKVKFESNNLEVIWMTNQVYRFVDEEKGAVCYVLGTGNAISCIDRKNADAVEKPRPQ